MSPDARTLPIDARSAARLAEQNLRFAVVDTDDPAAFASWFDAMQRGFYEPRLGPDDYPSRRAEFASRRNVGVWDDHGADPSTPIATSGAWQADVTVPGGRSIPSWAISTVTVAPTHRRRGIATNLIESELRTAAALSLPVAILTASEASIYERFGFSPAAMAADWKIEVKRTRWTGPIPSGRVELVPSAQVRDGGGYDVLEKARLSIPGQLQFSGLLWNRLFGMDETASRQLRVARYDDSDGTPQGFVIYRVENVAGVTTLHVTYLIAVTDDAYAALWRFVLEFDLVDVVHAHLRPVEEPLFWQISNSRAARKTNEGDHLWLRILDVKATLEARTWSAPGRFVLQVSDPLGYAQGDYRLDIASDGVAQVTATVGNDAGHDDGAAVLRLSVNALSASYLGATSVSALVHAGRIAEVTPGAASAADASFRGTSTPWLSIWF